jgi:hypothetical protein
MKSFLAALLICLASNAALAATGMLNLYIRAAAAWEQCTGNTLTPDQAVNLSGVIARHALETVTPEDLLREVRSAGRTLTDCDQPLVEMDRGYFEKFVLPRIAPAPGAGEARTPDVRVAGQ